MLARRVSSILPAMSRQEALEVTKIYSIAGLLGRNAGLMSSRPFRSPHHTISSAGMIGGGTIPKPGEVTLSHNGVLFLDELPEFGKSTLEVLRQPLEDGEVCISRVHGALRRLFLPDRLDKKTILRNIAGNARRVNFTADEIKKIIHEKYNVDSSDSLTVEQAVELNDHFYDLLLDVLKREHNLLMTGKK